MEIDLAERLRDEARMQGISERLRVLATAKDGYSAAQRQALKEERVALRNKYLKLIPNTLEDIIKD